MQWLENLKDWYQDSDNSEITWWIVGATAVAALFVYSGLFWGGRALVNAISDDATITVKYGNPCLTLEGKVRPGAPASCYEDNRARQVVPPPPTGALFGGLTRNNDASVSSDAYNPPCKKDGLPGCSDRIYGKRAITGIVDTVTFYSDDIQKADDGHLQPDYTEVKFAAPDDQTDAPNSEKFCGNVLDKFTPGEAVRMVLNESKLSDYNGCYTIEVVRLTFGGENLRRKR